MSSWRSFDAFREGLGEISQSAVDYINKRRAEKLREQQFATLKDAMAQRFNRPAAPGRAPSMGSVAPGAVNQPPLSLQGPSAPAVTPPTVRTDVGAPGSPGVDTGPDMEMLRMLGVDAPRAMDYMTKRYTPQFEQFRGAQSELEQFQVDPETGAALPASRQTLVPPIPRAATAPRKNIDRVVGRDGFYYDVFEDPASGFTQYKKSDLQAPESKESPKAKNAEKYRKVFMDATQTVGDMEEQYSQDTLKAWRDELRSDADYTNIMGQPEGMWQVLLGSLVDRTKAQKIAILRQYEKALASKRSTEKLLNGLGYQADQETGELVPVNPKAAKREETKVISGKTYVKKDGKWYGR